MYYMILSIYIFLYTYSFFYLISIKYLIFLYLIIIYINILLFLYSYNQFTYTTTQICNIYVYVHYTLHREILKKQARLIEKISIVKSKLNKLTNLNEINYQYQQLQYKNIELLCNIDIWKQRLKLLYDIYITIKPIDDIEETGRYNKDIFILDGCFELYNDINQTSTSSQLQQQTQQQQQLQHQQQQQQQHSLQLFNNSSLIVNTNSTTAITTTTADNADVQNNHDNYHNNDNYHNHDNHHVGQEIITNSLLNESNIEQINFTNSNKMNKNQDITMIGKSRVFMSIKPSDLEVFMAKDKVLNEALKEFKGKEGLILVPKQDNEGYRSRSSLNNSSSNNNGDSRSNIDDSIRYDGNNINNNQMKNAMLRSTAAAAVIPDVKSDTAGIAAAAPSTTATAAVSEQNMMQWIVLNVSDCGA